MNETVLVRNINAVIGESGKKKKAVAKEAGITPQAFSAMLHGRKIITAIDVLHIANALEVTPNTLFGFDGTPE